MSKPLQSYQTWKKKHNLQGSPYNLLSKHGWQKIGPEFTYVVGCNETPKEVAHQYLEESTYYEETGEFLYLVTGCNKYEGSKVIELFHNSNHALPAL